MVAFTNQIEHWRSCMTASRTYSSPGTGLHDEKEPGNLEYKGELPKSELSLEVSGIWAATRCQKGWDILVSSNIKSSVYKLQRQMECGNCLHMTLAAAKTVSHQDSNTSKKKWHHKRRIRLGGYIMSTLASRICALCHPSGSRKGFWWDCGRLPDLHGLESDPMSVRPCLQSLPACHLLPLHNVRD